jgi:hypothetical protein
VKPLVAVARQEADPVRLERVERVGDLVERALDGGHGHRREHPEAPPAVGDEFGRVLVALSRELARAPMRRG